MSIIESPHRSARFDGEPCSTRGWNRRREAVCVGSVFDVTSLCALLVVVVVGWERAANAKKPFGSRGGERHRYVQGMVESLQ
jgi:hypothetical protein